MKINLRDYQLEVINQARRSLRISRRVLLQAPTGAGKTALAAFIAGETSGRGRMVFFICHRAELVFQTSMTFRKFGINHGVVAAGYPMTLSIGVQICSIDTLKNRLHKLLMPDLVIWDECHHLAAAGWQKVQEFYSSAIHIGLSATPQRLDGTGLDSFFDDIVLGPPVSWLIDNGHLSGYRAYSPSTPDMTGIRKQMGDFARGENERAMDKPKLTGDAITHWLKYAKGLRSVGFAVTVAHSQHLTEQFNRAGIQAAHLDGGTPKAERARIIQQYAGGDLSVLFNVDLFGEGFDLSAIAQRDVTIDCVMQMRPTQSLSLHLQQIGRALRPSPGKTAIILDHAGNIMRHGLPDDDRDWSLEGTRAKRKGANDNEIPPPITCGGCFGQIRRPAPPTCPYCGHKLAPETKEIEVADGDLQEITEAEKVALRAKLKSEQAEAKSLQELVALGAKRGYKSPQQWAFKVWSNRRHG